MIRLWRPSDASIRAFLAVQEQYPFTDPAVGATAQGPPAGYDVDRTRVRIGEGEPAFSAARAALLRWVQFNLGWTQAWPPDAPIREGQTVAVVARTFGVWWLNAARIVYVLETPFAFGFAYGTVSGHAESGEERFLIEWDREEGGVNYDILAFSRPNVLLARLGYPLARRYQQRFREQSTAAMQQAVTP